MRNIVFCFLAFMPGLSAVAGDFSDPDTQTLDLSRKEKFPKLVAKQVQTGIVDHGIVILRVISDPRFDYELWTGVKLISTDGEKNARFRAVSCTQSHCMYIGMIPAGAYFIDELYSYGSEAIPGGYVATKKYVPIRNTFSSFHVETGKITDLGLLGVYGIERSGDSWKFGLTEQYIGKKNLAYLKGRLEDILPELSYDDVLGWDTPAARVVSAHLGDADLRKPLFMDFAHGVTVADSIYFPSALGLIARFSPTDGYSLINFDTDDTLYAFLADGESYIAGGEFGTLRISRDAGQSWQPHRVFSAEESVIDISRHEKTYYVVTQGAGRRIRFYAGDGFAPESMKLEKKLSFGATGKQVGFFAKITPGIEASLNETRINRNDLKALNIAHSKDAIYISPAPHALYKFQYKDRSWKYLRFEHPVYSFEESNGHLFVITDGYSVSRKDLTRESIQLDIGDDEFNFGKLRVTSIYEVEPDFKTPRKLADYAGRPGSNVAILGDEVLGFVLSKYNPQTLGFDKPGLLALNVQSRKTVLADDLKNIHLGQTITLKEHGESGVMVIDRSDRNVFIKESIHKEWVRRNFDQEALAGAPAETNQKKGTGI